MRTCNEVVLSGADISTNQLSGWFDVREVGSFAVQAVWTGNAVGTMILECSCDLGHDDSGGQPTGVINYFSIPTYTYSVNNNAGTYTFIYNNTPGFRWVRLRYTASSGTGNFTSITFNAKGF